ncbi:PAS domain S-box-containing protein [Hymenobacter luteus]|uniref:histidine kinase n=2 Tax=Hymenobacter TaxID=89966 RepID=A0A7W9SYR0_9BACT|nr:MULTISPECIES: PAS domain-containing sensor histidine kinase [Hymenobacter]MBB4601412.1 PAS domain S-box-containing protein [Hymenobacter latericoloratus]MBB6058381.1 PAS domain S-box-containing protein [Hymenobacter luteus]
MPLSLSPGSLTDILFAQAKDFIGVYDLELGWFTQVNPAGYQLLGYPSAAALYADPARSLRSRQLMPPEWDQLREKVLRSGYQELEVELRRQDGGTFWASLELHSLRLEDRPHLLVRITDTDRLRATERRLSQSVGRFEAVFAHATIGIIVCNRQGDIVLANEKAQELFDYPTGTLLGQRIDVLVPEAVSHRHEQLRASFNANPQVRAMGHNRDLQARRRDGSVFPVEVSLSYFHLEDELFVVSYVIDITFKKEAERELIAQRQRVERLNAELEQKVTDRTHALLTTLAQLEKRTEELGQALRAEQELGELKSRFVSMASHEFRTPLTAVLTSTALIEKYPGADQQDKRVKHLQRIRASVNHLNDILEEFLSVGRIEEGRIEARPVQLDLPALLHETIADLQGLRKAGQTIVPELECANSVWLDPSLLRKILVNLLSNALKYSGEGSEVRVRAECRPHQVLIQVRDQGVGISPEDQQHLFERFFRARNVANVPGTGLGLYIIAKYLELMGGTIALESEVGVGTTVTVTIPL